MSVIGVRILWNARGCGMIDSGSFVTTGSSGVVTLCVLVNKGSMADIVEGNWY